VSGDGGAVFSLQSIICRPAGDSTAGTTAVKIYFILGDKLNSGYLSGWEPVVPVVLAP